MSIEQLTQERQVSALRNEIEAAREKRKQCNGNREEYTRLGGYVAGLLVALGVVVNPDVKIPY